MVELPKEACWNSDDVAAVISNEALEGHEGIFLATHTPIRDFEVTGSHAGEIDGRDEQAVLLALSDPSRSHAFCVVQGEPGSGKSHLIRWLFVNWLQSDDLRSEEHTSELQSLMRISYAVFCLKKKTQNNTEQDYGRTR